MNIDIPEIGDEVGLRRLVVQTIRRIQAQDMPEAEKQGWIAVIEG